MIFFITNFSKKKSELGSAVKDIRTKMRQGLVTRPHQ